MWVIGAIGFLFVTAGSYLTILGISGILRKRRLATQRALHPDEPWFGDYFWNPQGAKSFQPITSDLQPVWDGGDRHVHFGVLGRS